jgi:hypothetical protein
MFTELAGTPFRVQISHHMTTPGIIAFNQGLIAVMPPAYLTECPRGLFCHSRKLESMFLPRNLGSFGKWMIPFSGSDFYTSPLNPEGYNLF